MGHNPTPCSPLDETSFHETDALTVRHHEVVEGANVQKSRRLFLATGRQLVGLTGLDNTQWMRVRKYDRCEMPPKAFANHLAQVNRRPVYRVSKQLNEADQSMVNVANDEAKGPTGSIGENIGEVLANRSRGLKQLAATN